MADGSMTRRICVSPWIFSQQNLDNEDICRPITFSFNNKIASFFFFLERSGET